MLTNETVAAPWPIERVHRMGNNWVESEGLAYVDENKKLKEQLRHALAIVDAAEKYAKVDISSRSERYGLLVAVEKHAAAARGSEAPKPVAYPDGTLTLYGHAMAIVDAAEKWKDAPMPCHKEVRALDLAIKVHAAAARGNEAVKSDTSRTGFALCSVCGTTLDGHVPVGHHPTFKFPICQPCVDMRPPEKGTGPCPPGEKGAAGKAGGPPFEEGGIEDWKSPDDATPRACATPPRPLKDLLSAIGEEGKPDELREAYEKLGKVTEEAMDFPYNVGRDAINLSYDQRDAIKAIRSLRAKRAAPKAEAPKCADCGCEILSTCEGDEARCYICGRIAKLKAEVKVGDVVEVNGCLYEVTGLQDAGPLVAPAGIGWTWGLIARHWTAKRGNTQ